jgi:serine/threonine-protein kinase
VQAVPNDVLAGKYRIVRMLGEGGMGIVAEAVHLGLGHRVALKLLKTELIRPEHRERFFREAWAAGSLRSEHVVAIKDVDTLPDGTPFLVMEYLEGTDLGAAVQQRGPLPVEAATDHVLQACHAVAEAHVLGIVHRDLKPANLFLTHRPDGTPLVKVLDFGIAKVVGPELARDLTTTSQYMGSPSYMSPEQVRSAKRVDARSDIWALGVILYELSSGTLPFEGETAGDVLVKISTEPPRRFTPAAPGLEAVILRCLQKDPELRYRGADRRARVAADVRGGAPGLGRAGHRHHAGAQRRSVSQHRDPAPPGFDHRRGGDRDPRRRRDLGLRDAHARDRAAGRDLAGRERARAGRGGRARCAAARRNPGAGAGRRGGTAGRGRRRDRPRPAHAAAQADPAGAAAWREVRICR